MGGKDEGTVMRNWVHESTDLITWSKISDAPWTARSGHEGVVFNNKIYIMGGTLIPNEVYSFDGTTWANLGNANWPGREDFCAVVSDGKMFV